MERLKRAFKNVNPYMAVSALIVLISFIVMGMLLWDGARPKEEQEEILIVLESEEEDIRETAIDAESEDIEVAEVPEGSIASETLETLVSIVPEELPVAEPEEIELPETESEKVVIETIQPLPEEAEVQGVTKSDQGQTLIKQEEAKTEESKVQETPQESQNENVTGPIVTQPTFMERAEEPEVAEPLKECNHSWFFSSYYQEPTCSSGGLENQICIHCGAGQTMPGTATGQHVFVTETEGDCCGDEIVICKDCNYREVRGKKTDNHIDVEDGFCYGCGMQVSPSAE